VAAFVDVVNVVGSGTMDPEDEFDEAGDDNDFEDELDEDELDDEAGDSNEPPLKTVSAVDVKTDNGVCLHRAT
jgi:hypothetical protein